MRADSYLARHHGLLAIATYVADAAPGWGLMGATWSITAKLVPGSSAAACGTDFTTVAAWSCPCPDAPGDKGLRSSATAVCGLRMSLHT